MKYIGQAVKDHQHITGSSIVTLGITAWGAIDTRCQEKLIRTKEEVFSSIIIVNSKE